MKKWLKRVTPTHKSIIENPHLGLFGTLLHDPNLWHLNRRSVAGAFAVGLFVMYLPVIGHTLIAAGLAIFLRVNLPIAVSLVWISNPITIPPMLYFAYVIGCLVLGLDIEGFNVHFWLDWHNWLEILGPLVLGCLICSIICSVLGYLAIQAIWRWKVLRHLHRRRERQRPESQISTPSSSRQT